VALQATFDGNHLTTAEGKVVRFFDISGNSGSIQQVGVQFTLTPELGDLVNAAG